MMLFAILVSMVIALAALLMYAVMGYAEAKGYERGLDDAEQIIYEVRNESSNL